MYNDTQVNKASYKSLLEYLKGLTGKSRETAAAVARKLIGDYKAWEKGHAEGKAEGVEEEAEGEVMRYDGHNFDAISSKMKRKVYKRARLAFDVLKLK